MIDFYRSGDGRRFLLRQATILAASSLALLAVFGDGRLDLLIARSVFDAGRHAFPLADQWLLKTVLHDAARVLSAVGALALLGVALISWITPKQSILGTFRRELLFAALAVYASAAAVTALKHFSTHACPWSLAVFGGTAPYHALLDLAGYSGSIGGCMPAAHPLTGYAWLGVGLVLHRSRTRARWWEWSCALGTLFGVVQVLRGAHFPSHVLWTAWVVWTVDIALLQAWLWLDAHSRAAATTRLGP